MIVSHKYKFIFIKSFKTAGTSLEIALSKFCGNEDIITPIVEKDEKLRSNLTFTRPQNYGDMDEHMTAGEIKKKLGKKIFDNYFKFVVVRNPYDQIIIAFYWHNESKKNKKKFYIFKKKPIAFYYFFTRKAHHIFEDEIKRYTENKKILIDKFVRYENLKTDLTEISKILNLPENIYEVFKNIKAKSNVSPTIEKRVKLTQDYKNQIKILAKEIIKLHKYKT